MMLTEGTGTQARRFQCQYNWSTDDGQYRVEVFARGRRFAATTFGLNSAKATVLCQAKKYVMQSNSQNRIRSVTANADGTPAQRTAPVFRHLC